VTGQSLQIFVVFSLLATLFGILVALVTGARAAEKVGTEVARMLNEHALTMGLASITATILIVPYIKRLTARRELHAWSFLLGKRVPVGTVLRWCAVVLVLIAASDSLTHALGRPVVAPWMVTLYESGYAPVLFLAIVGAAPLFEELLVRSFTLGGLIAAGTRVWLAVGVSSLTWAALHIQYDWYGVATILPAGVLLAVARLRTGSIYPCIAMHALANAVAFVQVVVVAS
jgi:membrane protease YdiL (CAAX protease family)